MASALPDELVYRKRGEICMCMIMIMPCGDPVTTVFVHKHDKTDVNRMCTDCAAAIRDTSEYKRYDLIPRPRKKKQLAEVTA